MDFGEIKERKIKRRAKGKRLGVRPKLSRRSLMRQCDDLVSKIVRLRDGACVCCGTKDQATCGHYFSRKRKSVTFNLMNCNQQCSPCNSTHNNNPEPYRRYMIKQYGETLLRDLEREGNITKRWMIPALLILRGDLQNYLIFLKEQALKGRLAQLGVRVPSLEDNALKTIYGRKDA